MKRLVIFLLLMLPVVLHAQYYDVLKWSTESEIQNGIKIKTKIPVDNNLHMPTITIEGYDYGTSSSIGLMVSWTLKDGKFENATASSSGGYAPDIILTQNEGLIQIFLKTWGVKTRFRITALADGVNEMQSWFENWTIEDSSPEGANMVEARYHNEFNGDAKFQTINTESAAINEARIGKLSVDALRGNLAVKGPFLDVDEDPIPGPEGQVLINGQDGGIDIISGNDNHSYIDFRGLAHLSSVQGRILHSDNLGFRIFTNGLTRTLSNNTVEPNPPVMVINNNGVVGIGNTTDLASTSTAPYKLFVEGGIRTRKLKVDATGTGWPDYVFEPSYGLRSLSSLEAFIKANKHLPDVPSADDVNKDGVDVGDVQATLLKKVEELTLYVIEQDKKQELLTKQLEEMQQLFLQLKKKYIKNKM